MKTKALNHVLFFSVYLIYTTYGSVCSKYRFNTGASGLLALSASHHTHIPTHKHTHTKKAETRQPQHSLQGLDCLTGCLSVSDSLYFSFAYPVSSEALDWLPAEMPTAKERRKGDIKRGRQEDKFNTLSSSSTDREMGRGQHCLVIVYS